MAFFLRSYARLSRAISSSISRETRAASSSSRMRAVRSSGVSSIGGCSAFDSGSSGSGFVQNERAATAAIAHGSH